MNRFNKALLRSNDQCPPVWFMRQAGRYHAHYQNLRREYSFSAICKTAQVSSEAALGPIRDFDFDAAILFSDILLPLEALGFEVSFDEGGPRFGRSLRDWSDLEVLMRGRYGTDGLRYQAEAVRLLRNALPPEKGVIGFVGAPLTLFSYAVEGRHDEQMTRVRAAIREGLFHGFSDPSGDFLAQVLSLQATAGADAVAIFDTCAGALAPEEYREIVAPSLSRMVSRFKALSPGVPVIYYSKGTGPDHWQSLEDSAIDCLAIDWRNDLADTLKSFGQRWAIQGNFDPSLMLLPDDEFERRVRDYFAKILALPSSCRRGWICSLGHGVLKNTPEQRVRRFIEIEREMFA